MKFNLMIITILCCLTASCMKWGNRENSRLIEQAQQLTEQMPDSALTLLDMANTASFGKAEKAEYQLMRIQARSNAGLDLSTDTEIFGVRDYFIRKKNPEKAALACFYAGLVAGYSDVVNQMEFFKDALHYAQNADMILLQGKTLYNMATLNYDNLWFDNAITLCKQALNTFQATGDQYLFEIYSLNLIANTMLLNQQNDSAHYYYQKALDQAYIYEDTAMLAMLYINMGAAYIEQGQVDTAIFYSKQALRLATTNNEKAHIYLNLAQIYFEKNILDSARYYIEQAERWLSNTDNELASASLGYLSYLIEKTAGNYQKALEYFETVTNFEREIISKEDRKTLIEIQKKYDTTTKENELIKQKNRAWNFAGASLVVLLALAVMYIGVLHHSKKQKVALSIAQKEKIDKELALEKVDQEKNEKTIELEKTQKYVIAIKELYNQRNNEMKTLFLEKVGVLKQIALLSHHFNSTLKKRMDDDKLIRKTQDIVKKLNAQNFIDIANELYPGFTNRLKNSYNSLDDKEICICCLILFDFNNEELDLMLNGRSKGTLSTVQNWKSAIRRKMNMPSYGKIKDFLLEKMVEN